MNTQKFCLEYNWAADCPILKWIQYVLLDLFGKCDMCDLKHKILIYDDIYNKTEQFLWTRCENP